MNKNYSKTIKGTQKLPGSMLSHELHPNSSSASDLSCGVKRGFSFSYKCCRDDCLCKVANDTHEVALECMPILNNIIIVTKNSSKHKYLFSVFFHLSCMLIYFTCSFTEPLSNTNICPSLTVKIPLECFT